ncbi:FKBP-type peptidyl-prolyl cis-trans isomerase [Luethyella okanaganae]|uniref:peptidylprolyl isomerase n=1 Tax=Luethyella okanaganae TaxID=69372 RepID=A0ABW1VFC7_9MICO
MRTFSALIATAGLLTLSLTACSAGQDTAGSCESTVKSGDASKVVKVSGDFGSKPEVDMPTPIKTDVTERTEVSAGKGPGLVEGQQVSIDWTIYNGTSGEIIDATGYDGKKPVSFALADKSILPGVKNGLLCATEGSRVTVVVPPADAFGDKGNDQLGIGKDDSIVFVIDVDKAYLTRANGADQPAQDSLPAVVLAPNGAPGVTVPSGAAPTDLEVAVLKKGNGEEVKEGALVTVHYTGVLWGDKSVFDSSWDRGSPAQFPAAEGTATTQGVIKGFADALIGQTVGSQVIAVIPPDQGYGEQGSGSVPPNATLIFVVDILGVG